MALLEFLIQSWWIRKHHPEEVYELLNPTLFQVSHAVRSRVRRIGKLIISLSDQQEQKQSA